MKIKAAIPENISKLMSATDRKAIGVNARTHGEACLVHDLRLEKTLQKLIRNELLRRGIVHQWCRMDKKTTGTPGWPDFYWPMAGRPLWLEAKSETGKCSEDQLKCHEALSKQGACGRVVTNFDQVKVFLDFWQDVHDGTQDK